MSATLDALTFRSDKLCQAKAVEVNPSAYAISKRPFVRIGGAVIGLLLSPLILTLVLLVRLTSPGPGLYRQRRVGLHGEDFTIYKIRSMRDDAEKLTGPVWAARRDPRVTPIGRFLRYSHLDELPQILNVIRGEMDFVGPRPERPEIVEELLPVIEGYQSRHAVLPGITGLAQVNLEPDQGIDCVRKKVSADCYYIQNASLWYDLRLIAATALRVLGIRYYHGAKLLCVTLPDSLFDLDVRTSISPADLSDTKSLAAYTCDTVVDRAGEQLAAQVSHSTTGIPR